MTEWKYESRLRVTLNNYDACLHGVDATDDAYHHGIVFDWREKTSYYSSDEAWPRLREGEVRTERIRYLAVIPYVNKPEHLVDFDELGVICLLFYGFSIPGCIFLFLLVNGCLGKQKKRV